MQASKQAHPGAFKCSKHQCVPFTTQLRLRTSLASHTRASANEVALVAPSTPEAAVTIKQQLIETLEGADRGIFGIPAGKKQLVLDLVSQLEALTPVPEPTQHLSLCHGAWDLQYSTITITGKKRTKLGLREFIKLGSFKQIIDTDKSEAINVVEFSVSGLSMVKGALTITASYTPESPKRVAITFKDATLVPTQLQKLFEANYDLLLSIFNPDGWLDITYLDDTTRVGRDDKGNVFLLTRSSA